MLVEHELAIIKNSGQATYHERREEEEANEGIFCYLHLQDFTRISVSWTMYVNVDSPNLGFPYFLGGPLKKNTLYIKALARFDSRSR